MRAQTTLALWRFDGNYEVIVSSAYTVGCPNGCCRAWYYNYLSANGSAALRTGECSYTDAANNDCSDLTVMTSFATSQNRVQLGACPANPSTLPTVSSSFSITAIGPLPGATTVFLSSSALQLNGVNRYATAPNSSSWNLPASYTLAAWINANADVRIVSQQSASGYWGLAVSGGGAPPRFTRRLPRPDLRNRPNRGWHLVHLVRNNNTNRRFYIDGVRLVGTAVATSTDSFQNHPNNATLEIGP